jgi:hypothetical protein
MLDEPPRPSTGLSARESTDARSLIEPDRVAGRFSDAYRPVTYTHFLKAKHYPVVALTGPVITRTCRPTMLQRDPTFHKFVAQDIRGQTEFETGFKLDRRTGNYLQRYPVGESVMVVPFFLAGHATARLIGDRADGFSRWE